LTPAAQLSIEESAGRAVLSFTGRLDAECVAQLWRQTIRAAAQARGHKLVFDLTAVSFCDVGGASLLVEAEAAHGGGPAELIGAQDRVTALLRRSRTADIAEQPQQATPPKVTLREVIVTTF